MNKPIKSPQIFYSISELHNALGLPKPLHPLVSLVNYADIKLSDEEIPKLLLLQFLRYLSSLILPER